MANLLDPFYKLVQYLVVGGLSKNIDRAKSELLCTISAKDWLV